MRFSSPKKARPHGSVDGRIRTNSIQAMGGMAEEQPGMPAGNLVMPPRPAGTASGTETAAGTCPRLFYQFFWKLPYPRASFLRSGHDHIQGAAALRHRRR